jgi:hypothetical protein
MLAETIAASLYPQWLANVETPEAKDAFVFLVGYAATLRRHTCHVHRKRGTREFRLESADGEAPFAFVVRRRWLLFHFRLPSLRLGTLTPQSIRRSFPMAKESRRHEWTVRLHDVEDARVLIKLLAIE